MGYYTDYVLKIEGDFEPEKIIKAFISVGDDDDEDFYEEIVSGCSVNAKWYKSSKETLKVSKLFPDLVFALYGDGEENGDVWVEYFKNGKSDYQKAVLPTYDESRLK